MKTKAIKILGTLAVLGAISIPFFSTADSNSVTAQPAPVAECSFLGIKC